MNQRLEQIKNKVNKLFDMADNEGTAEVNVFGIMNDMNWMIKELERLSGDRR